MMQRRGFIAAAIGAVVAPFAAKPIETDRDRLLRMMKVARVATSPVRERQAKLRVKELYIEPGPYEIPFSDRHLIEILNRKRAISKAKLAAAAEKGVWG